MAAMEQKFGSIEADVFLIRGKLWVGHDRLDLVPERNLESMYLEPMFASVRKNHGSLYAEQGEVTLLIDVKENPLGVYEELKRELAPYREFLTSYEDHKVTARAIKVVISGERATDVLAKETERFAFIDGRVEDLEPTPTDASLISMVSADWTDLFGNTTNLSPKDRKRALRMIENAHRHGQKVRFWGTANTPAMWSTLLEIGVDVISADDLPELAKFLQTHH